MKPSTGCAKQGQTAVFFVIGMIIIAVVVVFVVSKTAVIKGTQKKTVANGDFEERRTAIQRYVQECGAEAFKETLKTIGKRGGKMHPKEGMQTEFGTVAWGRTEAQQFLILEELKKEITFGTEENLATFCTFHQFEDLTITPGKFEGSLFFKPEQTTMKIIWPIQVKRGTQIAQLKEIQTDAPIRIQIMHAVITKALQEFPQTQIPLPEGMQLKRLEQEQGELLVFIDEKSEVDGKPFRFATAVQFTQTNVTE